MAVDICGLSFPGLGNGCVWSLPPPSLLGLTNGDLLHWGDMAVHQAHKPCQGKMTVCVPATKAEPWAPVLSDLPHPALAVWLSCLGIVPQTGFPVGAHAWVVGLVFSWGATEGNQSVSFSHIDVSPSLSKKEKGSQHLQGIPMGKLSLRGAALGRLDLNTACPPPHACLVAWVSG